MRRQKIPKVMENDWMRSPIPSFSPYSFDIKPSYGNTMYDLDIDGLGDRGERAHPIPKFTPTSGYYYRNGGFGKLPKIKKLKIKKPKIVKKLSTAVKKVTKTAKKVPSIKKIVSIKKPVIKKPVIKNVTKKVSSVSVPKLTASVSSKPRSVAKPRPRPVAKPRPRPKPKPKPKPKPRPVAKPKPGVRQIGVRSGDMFSPDERRTLVGAGILMVLGYMVIDAIEENVKKDRQHYHYKEH